MQKFIIKTHGCKSNQLESTVISEKLKENGFCETKSVQEADIFILNSCSVTENADIEALRTIRNMKHKKPELLTILTGCSAQLNSEKIQNLDYIDILLGNDDKFRIVEFINNKRSFVSDIFDITKFNNQLIHDYSKTRGYLKIQDGCNNYCSYCTIPLARGNSRSNSVENIVEQVNLYKNMGIKELVLTGIHIGQWGLDFGDKKNLLFLLEELEKANIPRYRLGSLNPLEMDDDLLKFLAGSEKFCPHFHLSLQSLNDKTLTDMNRNYSSKICLDLIEKINSMFKLPFLGSDIIVGFPDETEDDFLTTIENAKTSKLSNIHVFPYSVRKNTAAASMKNQLSEKVKRERAAILHKIAQDKFSDFVNKNIDTVQEILVEKRPDKATGLLKGVTKNYLNVLIKAPSEAYQRLHNTVQSVKITSISEDFSSVFGELLSK